MGEKAEVRGSSPKGALAQLLQEIYHLLLSRYGPQHWWPAEDPFEVVVGAILTQSTAWTNVEQAITNLKGAGVLSPKALRRLSLDELARLIRPSGYHHAKAIKLKVFAEQLRRYGDDLGMLFALDIPQLRQELLSIHGIGEETADSIILYAARKPIFVVDAYTRRILRRLGLAPKSDSYSAFQALFADNLSAEEGLFNEYHALLVRHGKEVCRKAPQCQDCCLRSLCPY